MIYDKSHCNSVGERVAFSISNVALIRYIHEKRMNPDLSHHTQKLIQDTSNVKEIVLKQNAGDNFCDVIFKIS